MGGELTPSTGRESQGRRLVFQSRRFYLFINEILKRVIGVHFKPFQVDFVKPKLASSRATLQGPHKSSQLYPAPIFQSHRKRWLLGYRGTRSSLRYTLPIYIPLLRLSFLKIAVTGSNFPAGNLGNNRKPRKLLLILVSLPMSRLRKVIRGAIKLASWLLPSLKQTELNS